MVRRSVVVDLCAGHGLTGMVFAAFERSVEEVWLVDKGSVRRLPSFDVYRTQQLNKLK